MNTGILLSHKELGTNILHLSYCHEIAKVYGPLNSASSYYMKTPPVQHRDHIARELTDEFIMGKN